MVKRFSVSTDIAAPRETVWRLLTDADSYERWNRAIVSITGPIVEGGTVSVVSTLDPKRTFKLRVAEMSAPAHMVWADGMPLGLFRGVRTFTLDAIEGGTRFSMVEEYTGPLAGLMTRVIPDMSENFQTYADGLKAEAERR